MPKNRCWQKLVTVICVVYTYSLNRERVRCHSFDLHDVLKNNRICDLSFCAYETADAGKYSGFRDSMKLWAHSSRIVKSAPDRCSAHFCSTEVETDLISTVLTRSQVQPKTFVDWQNKHISGPYFFGCAEAFRHIFLVAD